VSKYICDVIGTNSESLLPQQIRLDPGCFGFFIDDVGDYFVDIKIIL